jgi:hypothetical protein
MTFTAYTFQRALSSHVVRLESRKRKQQQSGHIRRREQSVAPVGSSQNTVAAALKLASKSRTSTLHPSLFHVLKHHVMQAHGGVEV